MTKQFTDKEIRQFYAEEGHWVFDFFNRYGVDMLQVERAINWEVAEQYGNFQIRREVA